MQILTSNVKHAYIFVPTVAIRRATNLCVCECVEPRTEKIRVGQCFGYARAGLVGGLSRIAYLCFRI